MLSKDCFTEQSRRLRDTWGDKNYPKERMSLFFRQIEKFEDEILVKAIDILILEERNAPMPPLIIESIYRAIDEQKEQQINSMPSLDSAVKISHNPEFAKICMDVIQKVISGKMNKTEYNEAMKYIDTYCDSLEVAERKNYCKRCGDFGFEFSENEKGYRFISSCTCSKSKPILNSKKQNQRSKK